MNNSQNINNHGNIQDIKNIPYKASEVNKQGGEGKRVTVALPYTPKQMRDTQISREQISSIPVLDINNAFYKDRIFERTLKRILQLKKLPVNCQSREDFKKILEKAKNDQIEPSKRGLYLFKNAIIVGSQYEILKKAGAESGAAPIDIQALRAISRLLRLGIAQLRLSPQAAPILKKVAITQPAVPKPSRDMELDNLHFELAMRFTLDIDVLPSNCKTIPDFIEWVKEYRAVTKSARNLHLYIIDNQMRIQKAGYEKKYTAKLIHEEQMISICKELLT